MARYSPPAASLDIPALLRAAAALQELAASIQDLPRVAQLLAEVLKAQSLTFSLMRRVADGEPEVLVQSSGAAPGAAAGLPAVGIPTQDTFSLADATYEACPDGPSLRGPFRAAEPGSRQISVSRQVEPGHLMKITLCRQAGEPPSALPCDVAITVLSDHLASSLETLLRCTDYPTRLDKPFVHLTEREWTVLCELNSEDSEKELAQRMSLSSHTLHSHIKSIYRKVGVRGRLPLLLRFRQALQEYRLQWLTTSAGKSTLSHHSLAG